MAKIVSYRRLNCRACEYGAALIYGDENRKGHKRLPQAYGRRGRSRKASLRADTAKRGTNAPWLLEDHPIGPLGQGAGGRGSAHNTRHTRDTGPEREIASEIEVVSHFCQ
jgi:hypothetical protein